MRNYVIEVINVKWFRRVIVVRCSERLECKFGDFSSGCLLLNFRKYVVYLFVFEFVSICFLCFDIFWNLYRDVWYGFLVDSMSRVLIF